jgi:hypothetical protein
LVFLCFAILEAAQSETSKQTLVRKVIIFNALSGIFPSVSFITFSAGASMNALAAKSSPLAGLPVVGQVNLNVA